MFATNVSWFDSLELRCDKQHSHARWTPTAVEGKVNYPTHSEAAYLETLCNRMSSTLLAVVLAQGAFVTTDLQQHAESHEKTLNRVVLGALPRGKHVKPSVSEFGQFVNVVLDAQTDVGYNHFLSKLPKGSTVQSRLITTWGDVRDMIDMIDKQVKKRLLTTKLVVLKQQSGQQCDHVDKLFADFFEQLGCIENSNSEVFPRDADFFEQLGCIENSNSKVFPREFRPPSTDVATLEALCCGMNAHVEAKALSGASNELAEVTWEETEKELAEGWMELDQGQGERAAWALIFGLKQKAKVRVINDFSIVGVNQTAGMREKLKIFETDDIAALIAHSLDSVGAQVHLKLLGKKIDLKSAYKQFGLCSEYEERIRVATIKPTSSELVLLLVNPLPLGATGSVAAFHRTSMFLWYIGVARLRLEWTSFYDEYTLLSRLDCAENAAWCAECLFDMLGVLFARERKKATSFDHILNALGVGFDLKSISEREVFIRHTESRRMELAETLQDLWKEKNYSAKATERLRDGLLWFENFMCGRQVDFLVARLEKFNVEPKFNEPMNNLLRETLVMLLARVEAGRPTEVSTRVFST